MTEFNNDIFKDPNYVSRSKIHTKMFGFPLPKDIDKKFIQRCFDNLDGIIVKTGNPFNPSQQRHTKVVRKNELYGEVCGEFRSISHLDRR